MSLAESTGLSESHDLGLEVRRDKRKHIKSRNGCSACKERKIKCDQMIPICSNCERRGLDCPYFFKTPFQIHSIFENQKYHHKSKHIISNYNSNDDNDDNGNNIDNNYIGDYNDNEESNYLNDSNDSNNEYLSKASVIYNYIYHMSGSINLNDEISKSDESIYQTHEMENVILSSPLSDMTTYQGKLDINVNNLEENKIQSNLIIPPLNKTHTLNSYIPLFKNTKISTRKFNTSHNIILSKLIEFTDNYTMILALVMNGEFEELNRILKGEYLDSKVYYNYLQFLSVSQIYNKLLRKSFLLFAMDYYKNIILRQTILPFTSYTNKLLIASECEQLSVITIDIITRIIKNDYLPLFNEFDIGSKTLFLASFIVLDDCLSYHFKSGLKYDMSFEDSEKAIQLSGIFTTGMYTMIIATSNENFLMSGTNILSTYLITNFKKLLMQNYHIKIFEDFKNVIDRLSINYRDNVDYENLKFFCDQFDKLLKINIHKSLLGFNTTFVFKSYNLFRSILPFDLLNLLDNTSKLLSEADIVIKLAYFTLNQIINSFIPGITNVVAGVLQMIEFYIYNYKNSKILMNLFKRIKNKKLQLIAIFLIRMGRFFNSRWLYYKEYLVNLSLDSLLNPEENISIHQRYLRLKEIKDNSIIDEIQIKTFSLERGQFIRRWNYPNMNNLKRSRFSKVANNKIMNFFDNNEDSIIQDFINNNNGFFSYDHDILLDLPDTKSVVKETKYIDGTQMKILWKLITYIRINNL